MAPKIIAGMQKKPVTVIANPRIPNINESSWPLPIFLWGGLWLPSVGVDIGEMFDKWKFALPDIQPVAGLFPSFEKVFSEWDFTALGKGNAANNGFKIPVTIKITSKNVLFFIQKCVD